MTIHRNIRRLALWRDDLGAAMVEFTLLAPFLLFLGLGMSEFGRFLFQYQLVLEGLRDGARYLARVQDPSDATAQTDAVNLAVYGNIAGTGSSRVDGWTTSDVQIAPIDPPIDNSAGTYRGGATIDIIEATTTFNYADVGFLSVLGLPSISIAVEHQQRALKD